MTPDGVRLAMRQWHPVDAGPAATSAAVVLVHGFGATKDDATVVAVADALVERGHPVVSVTGRGHGDSEGLCTLGDLEHHDVAAAVDIARTISDRVVLVGTSMGAIAVLRHAAGADGGVAGVVTVSSPAEWRLPRTMQSAGAALLTQLPPGRWAARRFLGVRLASGWTGAAPPVELAANITVPHVVVHGTGDRFIHWSEGRKLHEAAAEPSRLVLVDRMGHAYMPESVPVIVDAVAWVLSHPVPSHTVPAHTISVTGSAPPQ